MEEMPKAGDTISYTDERIEWEIEYKSDDLDGIQWAEYCLTGVGVDGKTYIGYCQGSGYEPQFDKYTDVEIEDIFDQVESHNVS